METTKFKHVYGEPPRPQEIFLDTRCSSTIWDLSNFIAASTKFFAMPWQSGGGGKVSVIALNRPGKQPSNPPGIVGHAAPVLDFQFHPFNESLLATCSEDGTAKLWQIPDDGLADNVAESLQTLDGHGKKKVGILKFHPSADYVLATVGLDHTIKIWDVEKGNAKGSLDGFKDQILSVDWNLDGSLVCAASKDKRLRVLDPRGNSVVAETESHVGAKAQKAYWAKDKNIILSVGFGKQLDRQVMLWDPRKLDSAVLQRDLDHQSGVLMAFIDEDTGVVYLGGKGDCNIRLFDLKDGALNALSEFSSKNPQRGLCCLPKIAVDTTKGEIAKFLRLENNQVLPISFICPRKQAAVEFQADIYPDTYANFPAINADQYFSGANAEPKRMSLKPGEGSPTSSSFNASFSPRKQVKPSTELLVQREKVAKLRAELREAEDALRKAQGDSAPTPAANVEAPKAAVSTPPPATTTTPAPAPTPAAEKPAATPTPAPTPKPAPPKVEATPGVTRLVDRKWEIENHKGTRANRIEIVLDADKLQNSQLVYIYKCEWVYIRVPAKVNSIQIVNCTRVDVDFTDLISSAEITNSKNIGIQVSGVLPSCAVDKSNDVMIYLSRPAMEAMQLSTCSSTGVNITIPSPSPDGDPIELAVPDQFVTRVERRKLVTQPNVHAA